MDWKKDLLRSCGCSVVLLGTLAVLSFDPITATAQTGPTPPPATEREPLRVAERSSPLQNEVKSVLTVQPNEHPLMPTIRWAKIGLREMEKIRDYSATVVKRQRVDGQLGDVEYTFVKVRHQPFSVYMSFLGPTSAKGQEVLYVQGANDGKMWAHGTGVKKVFGTVELDPTGPIAMKGNLYPITELGIQNMLKRLIDQGEKDSQYGECEVKFFPGAKINDRSHTCIQVLHPVARRNFLFHLARIFVDEELNLPTRFECYDWPKEEGGKPELMEEYTYLNVKFNNGFTDTDFDVRNPNYGFKAK